MALSLQSPSLVRQKVYAHLGGTNNQTTRQKLWWRAAKEFFEQWVTTGGNADLQFLPFAEADADAAGGTVLADAPCQVYLFYVKKLASATENTVKLFDDATDDATTTDQAISMIMGASGQECMHIYPTGFDMLAGAVITQHTTPEGVTDGSDGGDGFIVIGAA